ncbi:MAG: TIR domain-containing protein [Desulfobaccales bacterium]
MEMSENIAIINAEGKSEKSKKRTKLSQADVPAYPLEHALRVAIAIADNYALKPTQPLQVASAMNLSPNSSQFRMLTSASIAYGLTEGGSKSSEISLTKLSSRIIRPLEEGDDIAAKREAFLKPRVIREFLERYNKNPIPKDNIAENVLISMVVPDDKVSNVLALIIEGAESIGLFEEIKGKRYVSLSTTTQKQDIGEPLYEEDLEEERELPTAKVRGEKQVGAALQKQLNGDILKIRNKKVFITHGKNTEFIDPIKKLLKFGELEAVVSVERQSVSKPVPDKVLDDMRACGAAIIHVEDELRLLDKEAKEHIILNSNVLIEIGAAMALFGRRFILLVKECVTLPSNLQGLYEVRYMGDSLDGNATIRLLEAINEMKGLNIPK